MTPGAATLEGELAGAPLPDGEVGNPLSEYILGAVLGFRAF